jgi:hypothetical protein
MTQISYLIRNIRETLANVALLTVVKEPSYSVCTSLLSDIDFLSVHVQMNRDMTGQYKKVCLLPDMFSNTCIFLFRCSSCALLQRKCFIFPQPQNFKQHEDVRIKDLFPLLHRLCLYNGTSVSPNVISQSCLHLQSNLPILLTVIINGILCLWCRVYSLYRMEERKLELKFIFRRSSGNPPSFCN